MNHTTNRGQALACGEIYYFGAKCPTCGFARRYTTNRKCVNCAVAPAAYIVVTAGYRHETDLPSVVTRRVSKRECIEGALPPGSIVAVYQFLDDARADAESIGGSVLRCTPME